MYIFYLYALHKKWRCGIIVKNYRRVVLPYTVCMDKTERGEIEMKHYAKRILAAVMLLAIVISLGAPVIADAAVVYSGTYDKRYNIMLVIDGSGSLIWTPRTDPDGMRYEFIDELFGILQDDGHNIGAIVFGGNHTGDPDDAKMQEGIMLNTGILSLDEPAPDGNTAKNFISNAVRKIYVDTSLYGQTDIGTALLTAERELQKMQKENGLESLVFLLTDGRTDIASPAVYAKSMENAKTATYEMSKNNIKLFGAFLNKGGTLDSSEIVDLVCAANGINQNSVAFQTSYVEINDAATFHNATTVLLQFLGFVPGPDVPPTTDSLSDVFYIPGIGIEEMNIRLYTVSGDNLPDLTVTLTQPDGNVLTGTALEALSRSSRTFRVYKLTKPMAGEWKLDITVPNGNKVAYCYSPILSVHVESMLTVNPDVSQLHANMDAEFTALLAQSGNVITDPGAYRGYDCRIEMTDVTTGAAAYHEVQPNVNHAMVTTVPLTYGTYEARVIFTCGDLVVASEPLTLNLPNHEPTAVGFTDFNLKYGLFQDKVSEIDLTQYADDLEDGKNLTFRIGSTTADPRAMQLQGSLLRIDNKMIGDNTISVIVSDSQGAELVLDVVIDTFNVTILFIIALILLIIIIAALVFMTIRKRTSIRPRGTLNVSFDMDFNGKERAILLELDLPGVHTTNKTTLQKLLRSALRNDDRQVVRGVYASDVSDYLAPFASELGKVSLSAGLKRKGQKTLGAIKVAYGKKSQILYGSAWDVIIGDAAFTLEFIPEEDQAGNPFDDPFASVPGSAQKKDDPLFDDLF